jgi:molybdenum cofactor biosynthesis protein B
MISTPLNIAVCTISDTRNQENDTSGSALLGLIQQSGHKAVARVIVRDDIYAIRACFSQWIFDSGIQVIISTGGTGLTGRDGTPEAVTPLLDKKIDGFAEYFRMLSIKDIGTSALQSRAIAGVSNGTFIFCLPGSTSACQLAWSKIVSPQLSSETKPCNLADLTHRLLEK